MSLFTPRLWLYVTALLLGGATTALAQPRQSPVAPEVFGPGHWLPFGPVNYEPDYRWFAQPDLSEYGCDRPDLREGYFFQYDRLMWAFMAPKRTTVGAEEAERILFVPPVGDRTVVYDNDADTSFIQTDFVQGNRFELGYIEDDTGWLASTFHAHTHSRRLADQNVQIAFNDPFGYSLGFVDLNGDWYDDDLDGDNIYGRPVDKNLPTETPAGPVNVDTPPITGVPDTLGPTDFDDQIIVPAYFDSLVIENTITSFGVELMKVWRLPRMHYGGVWEWMAGARYFNMSQEFDLVGSGGVLSVFELDSRVRNHVVGPQVGFRWHRTRGRWTFSTEGRFTPGVNFQQARVNGNFATQDPNQVRQQFLGGTTPNAASDFFGPQPFQLGAPDQLEGSMPNLRPTYFDDARSDETFAPLGELRFETHFQLTRMASLRMGYTGLVTGGVGHASRRIDYTIPDIRVLQGHKNEAFIVNGFNVGFELNR
jgi:hypothetical protein